MYRWDTAAHVIPLGEFSDGTLVTRTVYKGFLGIDDREFWDAVKIKREPGVVSTLYIDGTGWLDEQELLEHYMCNHSELSASQKKKKKKAIR